MVFSTVLTIWNTIKSPQPEATQQPTQRPAFKPGARWISWIGSVAGDQNCADEAW